MDRWNERIIEPVIKRSVNRLKAGPSKVDLVRDFTLQFPARIIFEMCNLSEDVYERFVSAAIVLLLGRSYPTAAAQAATRLSAMLRDVLVQRRSQPLEDDLVSSLAAASAEDGTISEQEAIAFLLLLLPGGAETTTHSSASLLWFLLHDKELLARVQDDRELIPSAIDETLRLEPALPYAHRLAVRDVTIGGVNIPAGSGVQVALGSANRDPERWSEPDRFDLDRDQLPHLAFGIGAHACIGSNLSRREMLVALSNVLDGFSSFELDPDAPPSEIVGVNFRGPSSLPAILG